MDNEDYEAQAKAADAAIANLTKMAQMGNFDVGAMNAELPVDDTISVGSKDLAAFDNDGMDDEEMLRMFEGGGMDGDLMELMDEGGDFADFDMDDPKALEKLEAAENARKAAKNKPPAAQAEPTKPQPKPAAAAAQPQPKPAAARPVAAAKPAPAATPAAKAAPAATADAESAPASKKLSASDLKIRNGEFDVLIQNVKDNITDVTNFMNRHKDPAVQQKYLPLIKQSEGYLKTLNDAKKAQEPVPPYKFVQLTAKKEKKNDTIGQDDVLVTLVNMINVKSNSKYSLKIFLAIGKEQNQFSKQVKGKGILEFNQKLTFTLSPANIRNSQNGQKLCKLGRCWVELHSHGMFFGSTVVGKADLRVAALQSTGESTQIVKIKDDDGDVIAELEVTLAVNRPFITPELEETVINIVKMGAAAPAPELKAAPVATTKPTATATTATAAAATTKPAATPAAAAASATPTTPAAAAAAAKPAAAAAASQKDPDEMSPREIMAASGFGLNEKVFGALGEFPVFVGTEALNHELAACTQMVKTNEFKRRLDANLCKERISDCKLRTLVLETQVGSGKLSLPEYIQLLKGQIENEQLLEDETIKVARWYKSKGKADDAKYYAELVVWFKQRKELTKKELEGAESMGDGDEDEEEE